MSNGFNNGKAKVTIYEDEVKVLLKNYKKIKKYINSPLYTIRSLDGTEKIVSKLVEEYNKNPID